MGALLRSGPLASLLLGALALTALTGCTTATYLAQAGVGQLDLALRARRIVDVIADPSTPPRLRGLLQQVGTIKAFGERQGLTPTRNYQAFVALDRPVVVYVVTACEPLRFVSKSWTFPIVGRVPYLGWFDRDRAVGFAEHLRDEGWDVDLGGASAYSTLGWFDDPILSTMIAGGDEAVGELAEVVLHESLHATIYVNGEASFNESLASFVGEHLGREYLDEAFGPGSKERREYEEAEAEGKEKRRQMHAAHEQLRDLYASTKSDEEKLAEKSKLLGALRRRLGFKRPITNATLAEFKTYHANSPALEGLLAACGGSFPRFLKAMKGVGPKDFAKTLGRDLDGVLRPLIEGGCKGG